MRTETVMISKIENRHPKKAKVDYEFVQQIVESLEDAKQGRIRRVV